MGDGVWQCGGYDTQGRPASPDVTDDEIIAEVDRCVAEYGRFGRAYAFFGFFLGGMADPAIARKYGVMLGHYAQVCGMPLA